MKWEGTEYNKDMKIIEEGYYKNRIIEGKGIYIFNDRSKWGKKSF